MIIILYCILTFLIFVFQLLLIARFIPRATFTIAKIISYLFILCLRIVYKYKVIGNVKEIKGQLIASNHISFMETIIYIHLFDTPCFIYKKELNNIWLIGKIIQHLNMIAIDRKISSPLQRNMILERSQDILSSNRNLIIFPEGTRVTKGKYKKFKKGIIHISQYTKSNIVPVTISIEGWSIKIHVKQSQAFEKIEDLEEIILN